MNICEHIFTVFTNLIDFNLYESFRLDHRLMFDIPSLSFSSSTLLKLNLRVQTFTDCLYLLDGRFNQLQTFDIELINMHPPDEEIPNNVRHFFSFE